MKRLLAVAVIAAVAVISCIVGFFIGYQFAHTGQPAVVARNLTRGTIPQITIQTDRGESHVIANLASHKSSRVEVSPQKKGVRVVAKLADDRDLSSQEVYLGSDGVLVASISDDSIDLDWVLW